MVAKLKHYLLCLRFWFLAPFLLQGLTWATLPAWTQNHPQKVGMCPCLPLQLIYQNRVFQNNRPEPLPPLEARLLIFHSSVQSHLNFCSVVWGFSCKSNINKLHNVQKKAIQAVIPGFVKYFYKDGIIPSHTKPAFKEYNILNVQSMIAKNALMFMRKLSDSPLINFLQ